MYLNDQNDTIFPGMENKYCNLRQHDENRLFFVELNIKLMDSLYLGSIGTIKDKTQTDFNSSSLSSKVHPYIWGS